MFFHNLKHIFKGYGDTLKPYNAERFLLLQNSIDLDSVMRFYNYVIDHMNQALNDGFVSIGTDPIYPLRNFDLPLLGIPGIIPWLMSTRYIGPIVSWEISYLYDDTDNLLGEELLDNLDNCNSNNITMIVDRTTAEFDNAVYEGLKDIYALGSDPQGLTEGPFIEEVVETIITSPTVTPDILPPTPGPTPQTRIPSTVPPPSPFPDNLESPQPPPYSPHEYYDEVYSPQNPGEVEGEPLDDSFEEQPVYNYRDANRYIPVVPPVSEDILASNSPAGKKFTN